MLGKSCLVLLVMILTPSVLTPIAYAQGDAILLPEPPRPKIPTKRHPSDIKADVDERRQQRLEQEAKAQPPAPSPSVVRDQKLREEAIAERPMEFSITASLVLSTILTKAPRKNYASEPSVLIHAYRREPTPIKNTDLHFHYGLRLANFTGAGVYRDTPGRFGFLYLGPMVAIGKLSAGRKEIPADDAADKSPSQYSRRGYLLAAGIAAQSRFAKTPRGLPDVDDDFNNKAVAFDSPGLWAEAHFLNVYFGAIAANIMSGVQFGKGKTFLYLGVSSGGWY